jgi:type IV pilus assembly protein PilC
MKFRYQVLDKKKQLFQGELEAEEIQKARISLMNQGYDVLFLEAVKGKEKFKKINFQNIGVVRLKEKLLFVKHLSLMIKSGLVLDEAIEALYDQAKGKMKVVLYRLLTIVRKGNLLSDGLKYFPYTFNEFFVNMVRVGESSGTLQENLLNLSIKLKKDHQLKTKVRAAMMYPAIVVSALGGLGLILAVAVLPRLLGFFISLNVEIPLTTRIFINISEFIGSNWYLVIIAITLLIGIVVVLNKLKHTKFIIHWLVFHLPIFHQFSATTNLANICRSMNLLLKGGITIDDSLEILARAVNNTLYRDKLKLVLINIKKGDPLSGSLMRYPHLFPALVTKMVHVGEISANLEETFEYLAEFYEDELDNQSKNLSVIIEPALLLIIGLLVGFVAMAIISPIYQITGGIRG